MRRRRRPPEIWNFLGPGGFRAGGLGFPWIGSIDSLGFAWILSSESRVVSALQGAAGAARTPLRLLCRKPSRSRFVKIPRRLGGRQLFIQGPHELIVVAVLIFHKRLLTKGSYSVSC